ncbi:uncharacterized protein LOC121688950 [Alosa sapidissima]|uniref:uncharacterized protein LOC121688950 n=1 Tax=Alosa sapidissima TaxID=34773 RepID=UPI001C09D9BB|nr:uncharacterized protein LOC121688950 [Alosa sapidissima]
MKMPPIPCTVIVLLTCLIQDHMGIQLYFPLFFSSSGGTATLPCGDVNCSSTTWIYRHRQTFAEMVLAKNGHIVPSFKAERLSLGPGCSLHISDITSEDTGYYGCEEILTHSHTYSCLTVPHVSASPHETEMEPCSVVTLHCLLYTQDDCGKSVADKGAVLAWVDEGQRELNSTPKRQIITTSACNITLMEKLTDTNPCLAQRTWRCQLTAGEQVLASANHTVRVKG